MAEQGVLEAEGGAAGGLPGRLARLLRVPWFNRLNQERDRWGLWAPVLIGLGGWCYFSLPTEPPPLAGAAMLLAGLALLGLVRGTALPALLVLLPALGFTAGQFRSWMVAAPVLTEESGPVFVTGRVVLIDRLEDGGIRVVLAEPSIDRIGPAATPQLVRVRLHKADAAPPPIGAHVQVLAILNPPPEAAAPGAYDFRRNAYFQRIGAVGFALKKLQMLGAGSPPGTWSDTAERLRQAIQQKVAARLPGEAGAVVTALLNGEQTEIPEPVMQAMRASGLAHLLSISGLHVALVAGLVFFLVRAILALIEPLALRFAIKKWAAVAALLASVAYLLLIGSQVPTERSVLMTGLVLLAVIVDRSALTLRLVALAATAILLVQPDAMIGPSFQMSFAAVLALVALFEAMRDRLAAWRAESGWLRRVGLYLLASVLTSVAATAATTPFSLYHFQQLTSYGVLANALAVPLTSFWVMPFALLAYALMPFGAEGFALDAMGLGIDAILWIAGSVASLPGAMILIPAMTGSSLVLMVLGGLWLCLWRQGWRWYGLPAIGLGVALIPFAPRPDLLLTADGELVAVREADGGLTVSSGRRNKFEAEQWQQRDGSKEVPPVWRAGEGVWLTCEFALCRYVPPSGRVLIVRDAAGLRAGCSEAAQLVINLVAGQACDAPLVIDRDALAERGAHAVYLGDDVRMETVRTTRHGRPWD